MANGIPANGNGKTLSAVFWMRVASITFGLWALVLPISAGIIVNRVDDIAIEQKRMADATVQWREIVERRLILLEERQADVRHRLREVELEQIKHDQENRKQR